MRIDRKMLGDQHDALEESARALGDVVDASVPDLEALAKAKWQLGYRLAIHLAHEDQHVYPTLKAHPNGRVANLAALFEREMGDLDQRFRDYLAQWSSNRVVSEWSAFAKETRLLLTALAQRIKLEEQELYPLIAQDAGR